MGKIQWLCISLFVLSLASCNGENEDGLPTLTEIRVKNVSLYDFDDVEVVAPGGMAHYGQVLIQESSAYQSFTEAYRYSFINVIIDGQDFVLQPIDYVGETPLGPGKFTYVIDVPDLESTGITLLLTVD